MSDPVNPTPEAAAALMRLFAACWEAFMDGVGVDAVDLESMLDHTGLAVWLPATEDDVRAYGDKFELEVGDMLLKLTDEGRAVVREGRLFRREDKSAGD